MKELQLAQQGSENSQQGSAEAAVLAAVRENGVTVRMGQAKVFDANIKPQCGDWLFAGVAQPLGRVLTILAGTEQQAAVPTNVGLTPNVAAADTIRNRVAARR